MRGVVLCLLLVGCGFHGAALQGDGGPADAMTVIDGAVPDPDAPVGSADAASSPDAVAQVDAGVLTSPITISGTVVEFSFTGLTPVPGTVVTAFRAGAAVATATADIAGNFSLVVSAANGGFDGYLQARVTGHLDTYVDPAAPLTTDTPGVQVVMITSFEVGILTMGCGVTQASTSALVGVEVASASLQPIGGAVVTSTPAAGKVCYDGQMGPSGQVTSTGGDGLAYLLNVPAGTPVVAATKAGLTFKAHPVIAVAGALTTTYVTP